MYWPMTGSISLKHHTGMGLSFSQLRCTSLPLLHIRICCHAPPIPEGGGVSFLEGLQCPFCSDPPPPTPNRGRVHQGGLFRR